MGLGENRFTNPVVLVIALQQVPFVSCTTRSHALRLVLEVRRGNEQY